MKLLIEKLYLHNWKCYQEQTIEFRLNSDRNVWIVFGQNGCGKTSILQAIIWCLYGDRNDGITKSELLTFFNRVSLKENPESELKVQLKFRKNDVIYLISRFARRKLKGSTEIIQSTNVSLQKNGINCPDPREQIKSLFPWSCRDFFFFDGVEIQRYADTDLMKSDKLRESIERILGIPELRNLRYDSKMAREQIQKKLENANKVNEKLKLQYQELKDLQDYQKIANEQLSRTKEELEAAKHILRDAEERLRQSEGLKDKFEELNRLQYDRNRLFKELKEVEEQLDISLQEAPISLLLDFVKEAKDDLQRQTFVTAKRSGSIEQLQKLLEEEICLCGRGLDEREYRHISQELENLQQIGKTSEPTSEALHQDKLRDELSKLADYKIPDLEKLLLRRDRLQDDLEEIEQILSRLKDETYGVDREETTENFRKVSEGQQRLQEQEEKVQRLKKDIENYQNSEEELQRELENLASQNERTAMLGRQMKMARGLSEAANELIEWRIAERKQTIEAKTSEVYLRVTNKLDEYVGVEVQDNYTLTVKTVNGDKLSPGTLSAGEKEALAFAFITGLNLASGTAAPLIMDTPFGHLDTQHQKNIVNSLPNLPSQVIVLATDRDFPDYLLQELRPHVAEIHRIRRLNATEDASIVEAEE